MQNKKDDNLLITVGRLEGKIDSLGTETNRLNLAILDMGRESDHKHTENIRLIEAKHTENMTILTAQSVALLAHKEEDSARFKADAEKFQQVFMWQGQIWFGFKVLVYVGSILSALVVGVWAIFKWLLPLLVGVKGLGD